MFWHAASQAASYNPISWLKNRVEVQEKLQIFYKLGKNLVVITRNDRKEEKCKKYILNMNKLCKKVASHHPQCFDMQRHSRAALIQFPDA